MNPLFQSVIGSFFRKFLAMAAVWAVSNGIFTTDETSKLIEAGVLLGTSIIWTLWKNYRGRIKFLTALELPAGTSESTVATKIKEGMGAKI